MLHFGANHSYAVDLTDKVIFDEPLPGARTRRIIKRGWIISGNIYMKHFRASQSCIVMVLGRLLSFS
jgi:hypothetical protein